MVSVKQTTIAGLGLMAATLLGCASGGGSIPTPPSPPAASPSLSGEVDPPGATATPEKPAPADSAQQNGTSEAETEGAESSQHDPSSEDDGEIQPDGSPSELTAAPDARPTPGPPTAESTTAGKPVEAGQPPPGGGPATEDEATTALDRKLAASLDEFDRLLLEKLKLLAEESARREGGGGSQGPAGGGGAGGSGPPARFDGSAGGSAAATGEGGRSEPGAAGGAGTETSGAPIPADVGDGSDDDIVARQLREAAMAETDPDLRNKLWEEYRRYKRIQSGPKEGE